MARIAFPRHDLYKVLGVESDASLEDIKKAYRDLAKKVHPDKAEGGNTAENTARFQQVSEAWEILRDEVLRRSKRRGRRERSGTYEAKPNHRGKPYFEEWGHDMPSSPDTPHSPRTHRPRSGSHAHTSSSHSMPFPSEWPSPAPEPQPAPREPSTDHHERRERRDSRGPAHHAVNLADRLAAMRMRVDMKALYNDLDATTKEMQYLAAGLHTTSFGHSEKEQRHWGKLFNDAIKTLNTVDDMYDDLDQWLEHVETGKPGRSPAAQLPIQLAYISAVTTVMKYSAIACVTIQGQILCSPYDPPQQYYDDLEARLKIFATACEPPQQS